MDYICRVKRVFLVILGLIFIVVGLGSAATGGVIIALFGTNGSMNTDLGQVEGNGYALVMNEFAINTPGDPQTAHNFAKFSVTADSVDGEPMFIGIGASTDVNKYFEGVPRDVVSDLSDRSARIVPIPGTKAPAPPGQQTFWLAKSEGTSPTVQLQQSSDNLTMVIMRATPGQPVSTRVILGVQADSLFPISIGFIVFGALLLILGIWALIRGIKPKRRVPPADSYPPGAVGAGGVPLGQSSLADLGHPPAAPAAPPAQAYPPPPASPPAQAYPPAQATPPAPHWPPPPNPNQPSQQQQPPQQG